MEQAGSSAAASKSCSLLSPLVELECCAKPTQTERFAETSTDDA